MWLRIAVRFAYRSQLQHWKRAPSFCYPATAPSTSTPANQSVFISIFSLLLRRPSWDRLLSTRRGPSLCWWEPNWPICGKSTDLLLCRPISSFIFIGQPLGRRLPQNRIFFPKNMNKAVALPGTQMLLLPSRPSCHIKEMFWLWNWTRGWMFAQLLSSSCFFSWAIPWRRTAALRSLYCSRESSFWRGFIRW